MEKKSGETLMGWVTERSLSTKSHAPKKDEEGKSPSNVLHIKRKLGLVAEEKEETKDSGKKKRKIQSILDIFTKLQPRHLYACE